MRPPRRSNNLFSWHSHWYVLVAIRTSFLKDLSFFSNLAEKDLLAIAACTKEVTYPKGSIVFNEGDPGESLLVVLRGHIKVVLYGDRGQEIILTTLGAGDYVGELALLDGAPRSATVVTLKTSTFLQLQRKAFLSLLRSHASLNHKVMLQLVRRLRDVTEEIRSLTMFDIYGRILRCLIKVALTNGHREPSRLVLRDPPTNQDLGRMIGCARESVSRAMKVLQEKGYLICTPGHLSLEQRALKQYWPEP
jgi:CRP/FNR family transcriptional regulator, cyclic AMP receptor protein